MAASTNARKVVIAVDRSPQAQKAFEWYLNSLHWPDNALVLIHVPEGAALKLAEGQWLNEGEIQKIRAEEKAESAEMKTTYNTILNRHNVKGEYRVVYSSKPGEAIVESAKSEHAMLIVMGTRGMGTVRRTIMGSVSDYVVHHSDVPVVVYRH